MNTGQELHDNIPSEIPLDFYTKSKIITTSKTAGVAALLSIAGTLVSVAAFFLKSTAAPQPAKEGFNDSTAKLAATGNIFMLLLSLIISGLLFYTLFTFSRYAKKGIEQDNRTLLIRGLIALGAYFRIVAILAISFLGLLLMVILMTRMGGAIG